MRRSIFLLLGSAESTAADFSQTSLKISYVSLMVLISCISQKVLISCVSQKVLTPVDAVAKCAVGV